MKGTSQIIVMTAIPDERCGRSRVLRMLGHADAAANLQSRLSNTCAAIGTTQSC